jgi:hypothetical protein
MPTTVVGLFKNPDVVEQVVRDIEALGFPRNEVRVLDEPETQEVTGVMSFPRLDFEVALSRTLTRIGASEAEKENYLRGLRKGGALVFATSADEKVEVAGAVMKRHGAVEIEEGRGPEPYIPAAVGETRSPKHDPPQIAGRVSQAPRYGPGYFAW